MAAISMVVDYNRLSNSRAALQNAVDVAAMAAAKEMSIANADTDALNSLADDYVHSNLHDMGPNADTRVHSEIPHERNKITVFASHYWEPFILQYVGQNVLPIKVKATASIAGSGTICMIGIGSERITSIHLRERASLSARGCGIFSNSRYKRAINVEDNAQIDSSLTCSAGGVYARTNSSIKPQAVTSCPKVEDPLAGRTPPPIGPCTRTNLVLRNGTHILEPGTYCGGIKIRNDTKVKLNPGIYVIQGGRLLVTDNAVFEGENVGFYFADEDAKLSFRENTTINLTAPKEGSMAGILMFERRNTENDLERHQITSANARMLLGTIYLPNGTLKIDSEGPIADKSAYTAIIAEKIILEAGPTLYLNSDYESTNIPVPGGLIGGRITLTR